MRDFFDQICEVLAETGRKHPGQLAKNPDIRDFFTVQTNDASGRMQPDAAIRQSAAPSTPPAEKPEKLPASPGQEFSGGDLDSLRQCLQNCRACQLSRERTRVVFGEGDPHARLMFVGEAPGFEEDQQGRPFVGKAGQLLNKMITAMQFSREEVYITNIVKCRPKNNRDPMPDEVRMCIGNLSKQIELIQPEVIVALGAVAAKVLLQTDSGISKLRGKWCSYENIPVMPTFHPAFLLRQEEAKKEAWKDLQAVMARFGKFHRKGQ